MAAQKGRDFQIAFDTGGGSYVDIGAATATDMTLNNNPVDVTTKTSAGIETMLADAGIQQMTISVSGRYEDASVENDVRTAALNRTSDNWRLTFPDSDTYIAAFVIEDYSRSGPHDAEEGFSFTLRRNGAGTYT